MDVIKTADWIIDLGPEGGDQGGKIVVTGTPEEIAGHKDSYTGQYLLKELQSFGRRRINKKTAAN
jgi:excinuclease ABC subunit A